MFHPIKRNVFRRNALKIHQKISIFEKKGNRENTRSFPFGMTKTRQRKKRTMNFLNSRRLAERIAVPIGTAEEVVLEVGSLW